MSILRDLYQQTILDHNKSPRNYRSMEDAHRRADGHNPLCGDRLTVFVKTDGKVISEVSFLGDGCAISKASASLMTQSLKGKTLDDARELFEEFHTMVTSEPGTCEASARLGKLAVFEGVCEFPMRVKCATLAWHTLNAALDGAGDTVSTE